MKITAQKIFVANVSRTNFVFVKLYTDDGIEGVGEATLEWKTLAVTAALEELERVLIGRDPFAVDAIIEQLHRDSYWRTGAVFRTALGAIEAALLDIKGKALGVPVFELLGGKYRDRIACYANHWFFGATTPEQYAENARKAVALGYKALKWDPFDVADLEMDRAQRRQTIDIVAAVRDAVGPDIDLMLDVHGRLNVPTAIAMCKALEPYDLRWIEEPTPPESIDALADVRAQSPVPIASGERWFEPGRFLEALQKKAVDILQPDVSHAGGLGETKRIAHMAHLHMIPVAPHNPVGPVMNAMTLHTAVAIPNFSVFETVSVDVPWRKELVRETLQFEDGALLAPTAPGLGVELIEEACAKYPYSPYNVPIFDGSMNTSGVATGKVTFGE
ncbi:mandelate racemase/muconate lactonizing enzyme family protein [Arsenicitalea aurantiaca]|uniref:Mandelate racemase/muconate lactonizing enzyme family protein n=1 Tax=Arsenicitalea aurantiaca TaxID=1783274 RepID=A0A433X3G1_9HYPH|nr:mandelate racemase/muconate lactonizing enzyme family protein [Arsenicitalea aurantiaca]RUT28596.1 mandelate racemase/muconate lactonizing enzyme family protein [Arsenicitalea aurantiaca]